MLWAKSDVDKVIKHRINVMILRIFNGCCNLSDFKNAKVRYLSILNIRIF